MDILIIILPVLTIALAGYLAVALGWLGDDDTDSLSRLTFALLIPCLLFVSTARAQFDLGEGLEFLAAYYLAVSGVYLLGLAAGYFLFGYGAREQSVYAMGCAYSNTTIVGIPVVSQALGDEALLPLILIVSIQNLVLFSIGTIAAERKQLSGSALIATVGRLGRQLLMGPITASLIAGLSFNLLSIPVWAPLFNSLELLSRAAVPVSLFVLGLSLQRYRFRQQLGPAALMTLINIVLLPLLTWVAMFRIFQIEPLWASVGVLAAAMPVGISAYAFANHYRVGHGAVATGSVLSALCALLTLSIALLILPLA